MADSELSPEAFLRAVFDSVDIPIIAATPAGVISVFNAAAERLSGYLASEIVGRLPLTGLLEGEQVASMASALSTELGVPVEPGFDTLVALAQSSAAQSSDWSFRLQSGHTLAVSLAVKALHDAEGAPVGLAAFPSLQTSASTNPTEEAHSGSRPSSVASRSSVLERGAGAPFNPEEAFHRLNGDVTLLVEVVDLFERERLTLLDALRRAVAERQPETIERVAHKLRGALLNLAAGPAAGAAGVVEDGARRGQLPTTEQLGRLFAEIDRLSTALLSFRNERAAL